jgi:hypothetical protein
MPSNFQPEVYKASPEWPNKEAAKQMGPLWNAVWALAVKRGDLAATKAMLKAKLVCIYSHIIYIGIS